MSKDDDRSGGEASPPHEKPLNLRYHNWKEALRDFLIKQSRSRDTGEDDDDRDMLESS